LFPLFATGVVATGGKFAAGIVDTGGKFTTGVNNTRGTVGKISAGVIDTGVKFAAGVVDTSGNLPPVSLTPVANLHRWCTLTCEYLREFSKKFEMILMLLSGAWGKVIHEKNLRQKSS
jgi:hypothetical protein